MSQAQLDIFNNFIKKATDVITCDAECEKQKKNEQLKKIYLDSKTKILTAPSDSRVAQKNYVTFAEGESAYNELNEQQLMEKAKSITSKFKTSFDNDITNTNLKLGSYNGLLTNFKNVEELHSKYVHDNIDIANDLKIKKSDIMTNDRKTYYEDQNIDSLKFYYKIFIGIYIFIIVVFTISVFFVPSKTNIKLKIFILSFLILYPFISLWLSKIVMKLQNYILNVLPKNVYKDI
jgi:hypothetical protein